MRFFEFKYLRRIDFKVLPVLFALMLVSLLVMSEANTLATTEEMIEEPFWTPLTLSQLKWFGMGLVAYFLAASFDYNKLREWAWFLYLGMLIALVGLFFTTQTHNVHRWYRIPGLFYVQPSEFAKLIIVIALSWFLEKNKPSCEQLQTGLFAGCIVGVPFLLILMQPDLGSALILFPITLVMFYFSGINRMLVRCMLISLFIGASIFTSVLLGVIPHAEFKPYATKFLREYQYQRLSPKEYHHKQAADAMAVGGITGKGWRRGDFTSGGWLPAAQTDSVFPNFGEHYGFIGLTALMALFYLLILLSFRVARVAKDYFGQLLATGVAVYLAMHILVNIGMMCGLLPITGVPLILVTYGGSSCIVTLGALGILQSVYSRRFMF